MDNNTWTPIYSGTTHKLISGVSENNIYIFIENPYSPDGGSWAQIGSFDQKNVFSGSGSSRQLIGEVHMVDTEYRCIINREESINISKDFCLNGIDEYQRKGLSGDYYENKLASLQKLMPRLLVARILKQRDNYFSAVHIYETGENYVDENRLHDVILYARADNSDQNASPFALAAAFLVVQFHCTFDDIDRPLKCLWDF